MELDCILLNVIRVIGNLGISSNHIKLGCDSRGSAPGLLLSPDLFVLQPVTVTDQQVATLASYVVTTDSFCNLKKALQCLADREPLHLCARVAENGCPMREEQKCDCLSG